MADRPDSALAAAALMGDRIDRERTRRAVLAGLFGRAPEPTRIDRFEIIGTLGQGAMGRVYAARDPKLERRVAIKVVRDPEEGGDEATRRDRLLQEARAMARLQHPNVVTVFEAGRTDDDDVYLAMELVDGTTLRGWAARDDVGPTERLAAIVDVARGLAAAHAIGLVHRDLKPDNVIVDAQGRARVTDFGLARTQADPTSGSDDTDDTAGTPAYMAPELHRGSPASALSDQFAFCVTAWETLTGARPHDEARRDMRSMPAWVRATLQRGLHDDPDARWPSMDVVRDRLARGPARGRLWMAAVVGAALVAAGASWWTAPTDPLDPCRTVGGSITPYTAAPTREAVAAAVRATGLSFAPDVAAHVDRELAAYGNRWRDAATSVCRGVAVDPVVVERGPACLEDAVSTARAVVTQLRTADAALVPHAHQLLAMLPPTERCLDPIEVGARGVASQGAETDARRRSLRAALDDLRARRIAGRVRGIGPVAQALVDDAEALGDVRLRVETRLMLAQVIEREGDYAEAQRIATDAFFVAESSHADFEAAFAATTIAGIAAVADNPEDILRWVAQARGAMARAPSFGRFAGRITRFEALAYVATGELDEAADVAARAYAQSREGFGADAEETAHALSLLGGIEARRGHADEALAKTQQAFEVVKQHLPEGHPTRAEFLNNLGVIARKAGDLDAARDYLERALAIKKTQHDGPSPALAATYNGLGLLAHRQGDFEAAREYLTQALANNRDAPVPAELEITRNLDNLAMVELADDHPARALELTGRALAGHDARGSDARERAITRIYRATALRRLDRFDEAVTLDRETLAATETYETPRPIAMVAATGIADGELGRGRADDAWAQIELARKLADAYPDEAFSRAELDLVEARALHALDRDPARVRKLTQDAITFFRSRRSAAHELRQAEGFLATLDR